MARHRSEREGARQKKHGARHIASRRRNERTTSLASVVCWRGGVALSNHPSNAFPGLRRGTGESDNDAPRGRPRTCRAAAARAPRRTAGRAPRRQASAQERERGIPHDSGIRTRNIKYHFASERGVRPARRSVFCLSFSLFFMIFSPSFLPFFLPSFHPYFLSFFLSFFLISIEGGNKPCRARGTRRARTPRAVPRRRARAARRPRRAREARRLASRP